jgi:hypothetical protein
MYKSADWWVRVQTANCRQFTIPLPHKKSSVAKGPKFRLQNTKGAEKIVWGRETLGPKFWQIYQKRAEKGPNFFWGLISHKIT